ncbi:MAG: ribosome maturation factor RimP [Actinomycetota bacterium]|nr:ribosome maturation factor RimP [Actinomycetota bacterium]
MAKKLANSDAVEQGVEAAIQEIVASAGLKVLEIEATADTLAITLEDPSGNVDAEDLETVTPQISEVLDTLELLDRSYPKSYNLEISSPGLERVLKTQDHFRRFMGSKVTIRTREKVDGERRFLGWIALVGEDEVEIAMDSPVSTKRISIALNNIERARSVFEWQGGEKKVNNPPKGSKKK